jgi:hypothetical protein
LRFPRRRRRRSLKPCSDRGSTTGVFRRSGVSHYGIAKDGFNISSVQFAIHYSSRIRRR